MEYTEEKKIRLLITSVGSLVGQNIIDDLEYNQFFRRDRVHIIGTNSVADSVNNFRCDNCYLVPNTNIEDFKPIMKQIILEAKPDIILIGRDEDTAAMWSIVDSNPELKTVIPYGNLKTVIYALDKWQSWQFTQNHGLPFAETLEVGKNLKEKDLKSFVEKVKYPIIAKPVRGFASKGVFFLRNFEDVKLAAAFDEYIFQEYLGNPEKLEDYFKKMDGLTPLFAHAPDMKFNSCYTVISPKGEISPIFISQNQHESGRTVGFRKVENEELESIMIRYAKAFYSEGGMGPLGVQFRQDRKGNWKGQEMNHRTNGNTMPRLILGQDEVGLIFKYFLPNCDFPIHEVSKELQMDLIPKTLFCNRLKTVDIDELSKNRKWSKVN